VEKVDTFREEFTHRKTKFRASSPDRGENARGAKVFENGLDSDTQLSNCRRWVMLTNQ
jgi:hypothetical protein